jgi:hypothetical protein
MRPRKCRRATQLERTTRATEFNWEGVALNSGYPKRSKATAAQEKADRAIITVANEAGDRAARIDLSLTVE